MKTTFNQQDIINAYQNVLGRSPTPQEINSFLPFAQTGSVNLTPFNIQQILQSTPEYQQSQLMSQGGILSNTLGQSDQRLLGIAGNQALSQMAQNGVSAGSSGYVNAFANAAANLAMSRQQTLANFYAPGFQQINANSMGQGNNQLGFGQSQQASTIGWNRQLQLAQMQQNWENTLKRQQENSSLLNAGIGLGGSILGGAVGGLVGGLGGAAASAGTGAATGQLAGYGSSIGYGGYGSGVGSNSMTNLLGPMAQYSGRQASY